MLEIEIKARVDSHVRLRESLQALGFWRQHAVVEEDIYLNGVGRDFANTDEALRLRRTMCKEEARNSCVLTYKGPKLDQISQTREEYETAVQNGEQMERILLGLGYTPTLTVRKHREYFSFEGITACVDEVEGLGSYMELELLSGSMDSSEEGVQRLFAILDTLGVPRENCTRKSYLEMLLEKQAQKAACNSPV